MVLFKYIHKDRANSSTALCGILTIVISSKDLMVLLKVYLLFLKGVNGSSLELIGQ